MRELLLVVDIQNDFLPGGALAVPGGDLIIPVVNALAARFEHVVLTQDWHPEGHQSFASSHEGRSSFSTIEMHYGEQILWPEHCVQGTFGAAFHQDLDIHQAEAIIRKGHRSEVDSYSAFFENDHRTPTGLAGYLRERGVKRIFICGLALDFCVAWSALDARRLGFDVSVVEDATRAIDTSGSLERAMGDMKAAGVRMCTDIELLDTW
jgi:nicotinamidase/pyrazinamidase